MDCIYLKPSRWTKLKTKGGPLYQKFTPTHPISDCIPIIPAKPHALPLIYSTQLSKHMHIHPNHSHTQSAIIHTFIPHAFINISSCHSHAFPSYKSATCTHNHSTNFAHAFIIITQLSLPFNHMHKSATCISHHHFRFPPSSQLSYSLLFTYK